MNLARRGAIMALLAILLQGCATTAGPDRAAESASVPLAVYGATMTVEIAPVLLAVRNLYPEAPPCCSAASPT
ncbi:MAG: hypothetical protein ACM3YM_00550 [Sphingomonadales bacterium]